MPAIQKHEMPDILFFFSDQHHGLYAGYAGHPLVQTPNLDRLAANGTACRAAYTSCPLCVPARSSMLTGQLPSQNGVFNNAHAIRSDQATFLHALGAVGYETVLCGRMHFKGPDQRHGFTRRICGDITGGYAGGPASRDALKQTFGMGGCVNAAGKGDSPVLEYDRAVIEAALDYLRQDHVKPQCIVVGTYGPHFPYVAPPEYFDLYFGKTSAPASWDPEGNDANPLVDAKRQRSRLSPLHGEQVPVTTDVMLTARAAYFGMITEQDRLLGEVRDAWGTYLKRTGRDGIFAYSSDHGDTCGEHSVFGKQTFYEGSTRIPMLFEGTGIAAGHILENPVSIMDIGPTLCGLVNADAPPCQAGVSLSAPLRNETANPSRPILSEWVQDFEGRTVAGRMVRKDAWKLMRYDDDRIPDQLFDVEKNPDELENCAAQQPDVLASLQTELERNWDPQRIAREYAERQHHIACLGRWSQTQRPSDSPEDRRPVPVEAIPDPDIVA